MTSKITSVELHDAILKEVETGYKRAGVQVGDPIVLAVSGGMDSVLLLRLTVQLWPKGGSKLLVAHLNHSIRSSSADDQQFVRALAEDLGVAFKTSTLQSGQISTSPESMEEAARKLRYDFLSSLAASHGTSYVATAHHKSDQAETILHNVLRGTGLRGLAGMRPRRRLAPDCCLVRPMLQVPFSQIAEYVDTSCMAFCEDESNQDREITRNRLRNEVLPFLQSEVNLGVEANLVGLAEQVSEAVEVLDGMASDILQRSAIELTENVVRLRREPIAQQPHAVRRHLMNLLWCEQQWPQQKMTRLHWGQLAAEVESPARRLGLPGGIQVTTTNHMIRIIRSSETGL